MILINCELSIGGMCLVDKIQDSLNSVFHSFFYVDPFFSLIVVLWGCGLLIDIQIKKE